MAMDLEALGSFYLGKEYDLAGGKLLDSLVMYDARDLTTHGVCVGMTGSGKTGLCVGLLEEAALDHVPALIIDPKGDIANLLLTFPELRPEDFRPWVNADDARRKGLTEDEFAAAQAESWRKGLAQWGQDGERIRRLREAADFVIYTPGSDAGVPVSILQSFEAPDLSWDDDAELLRERIQNTVSALLGLIGIEADPVRSREHILLSNILEHFWRQGEDLDLARIILAVQNPPVRQLGVFDVDTFFPAKERFALAVGLNNLIAAPSFQAWMQGQPLDIGGFLATPDGKTRHSIFYIAHLSDAERMFFVTMLLSQVTTWIRTQPGTTSLRALLYMDEIAGFFPPVANPPSKAPMLTLLKQARAFGLGVLLTTQNPVDLDYKGLTNTGTWFIGRLQAERDKLRLLDGLESAAQGTSLDRAELNRLISGLESRVFLLHNVHEDHPITFGTRWAMSYLRGPLTRSQVRTLTAGRQADVTVTHALPGAAAGAPAPGPAEAARSAPPVLPRGLEPVFVPPRRTASAAVLDVERNLGRALEEQAARLVYEPMVAAAATVYFRDARRNVDERQDVFFLAPPPERSGTLAWAEAEVPSFGVRDLASNPEPDALYDALPETLNEAPEFSALKKDLADYLYRQSAVTLLYSPTLKAYSLPNEDARDFGARLQQNAREARDAEVDALASKYAKRLADLRDRLAKAEAAVATKRANAQARTTETVVSVGESLLGAFLGGRRPGRAASTALSKNRQRTLARMEAEKAEDNVVALREQMAALEAELRTETEAVKNRWAEALGAFDEVKITPRRTDVDVQLCALAWVPQWEVVHGSGGLRRAERVRAL